MDALIGLKWSSWKLKTISWILKCHHTEKITFKINRKSIWGTFTFAQSLYYNIRPSFAPRCTLWQNFKQSTLLSCLSKSLRHDFLGLVAFIHRYFCFQLNILLRPLIYDLYLGSYLYLNINIYINVAAVSFPRILNKLSWW